MISHILLAAAMAAALALPAAAQDRPNPLTDGESWAALRGDLFGDRAIQDGAGLIDFDAPYRAHDAATVPVEIRTRPDAGLRIVRLALIVDENPAPVAAEFTFGDGMADLDLATRVRVNAYSNIRAVAEAQDGTLYMVGRFVKASGGCAAPAMKDADAALAQLGKMKLRLLDASTETSGRALPEGVHEAQIMIRHPNYSGLQINQLTQLFIPAHFVHEIEVTSGETLIFRMTGGISISEDPAIRFRFRGDEGAGLSVRAEDTDGAVFEQSFPVGAGTAS